VAVTEPKTGVEPGLECNEFWSLVVTERWYSAGEINFKTEQIIWILENLAVFRLGIYPRRPDTVDSAGIIWSGRAGTQRGAGFERACDITAEIEVRLKMTGFDGFLLEAVYSWQKDDVELAVVLGMDFGDLQRRINRALKYVSGYRRKKYSYKEYVGHRKVRVKENVGKECVL
jgi:hypothetical protein